MSRLRTLACICFASGAWSFSFGFASQVISHWLKDRGASNTLIGLNHSAHYLGLAIASLAVPGLMRRWGYRCAAGGMLVSAISLAVFPLFDHAAGWFLIRLLNGMAGAVSLIPLETLVSRQSKTGERSRAFGVYGVALVLGGAIGLWVGLSAYDPQAPWLFPIGAVSPLFAAVMLTITLPGSTPLEEETVSGKIEWKRNVLSFGTAWSQGFLEGGMLAFMALYLESIGMTADAAGFLMAVTMAGVIVLQVPLAWAGDRFGRVRVLLLCYLITIGNLALLPSLGSMWILGLSLFVLGAFSGAMYPLGLALLGERNSSTGLAWAYSVYLAMECLGSQMGSAVAGPARDIWGEAALFAVVLAAMFAAFAVGVISLLARGETRAMQGSQNARAA